MLIDQDAIWESTHEAENSFLYIVALRIKIAAHGFLDLIEFIHNVVISSS
jgi:hypothetical protein